MLRKLDRYEILHEIGHGGMATVYRARDTRLERLVAIKLLHPHLRSAPEAKVRFTREARSVARLRHRNILEIYDNSGEDSEESYIVTELLTGPTLKEYAESRPPMPPEIAACFAIEIARALACAHEAGIVHRDVKPENVLLHEDRRIKLTDFGIAQMVDSQSFTATGQILGSPGHMAPEQVEGGDCDERTDVFSLGTVLYYLATGKLPFTGRNPHQILKRLVDGDYVEPLRVRAEVGGRLSQIIVRALSYGADARHQSAAELEQELTAFVSDMGVDDVELTLARFLEDPDGVTEQLRGQVIERLIALGKTAMAGKRIHEALQSWNRVLAMDDSHEEVLALVERAGQRVRRRTGVVTAGAAMAVFGVAAIGYSFFAPDLPPPRLSGSAPDAGQGAGAPSLQDSGADATVDAAVGPVPSGARDAQADTARRRVRPVAPVRQVPREVVFRPVPRSVSISVDGAPSQPWGPRFPQVTLMPGRHTFDFVGGENCCEPLRIVRTIPPGSSPYVLAAELHYRAIVFVDCSAPRAKVVIGDGAEQAARQNFAVRLNASEQSLPIRVTAPGHAAYTGTWRFRAGATVRIPVTLEASGSSP